MNWSFHLKQNDFSLLFLNVFLITALMGNASVAQAAPGAKARGSAPFSNPSKPKESFAPASPSGTVAGAQSSSRLNVAENWLGKSVTGSAILALAKKQKIVVHEGPVSKTELTATRYTDGKKESLRYSTQVMIAASKDPVFQALDMAHELTHASHPNSNPFDPNLNAEIYVRRGIESEGGEAQAILQECRVGRELLPKMKDEIAKMVKARCQLVWNMEGDEVKWKRSFYQLGQYYEDFMGMVSRLKMDRTRKMDWAQEIEPKSPMFASAVTHKPYPLALLEEYLQVTEKICQNGIRSVITSALNQRCTSIQDVR